MAEKSAIGERFKKIGSQFAFNLAVEWFYDDIVNGFRDFLAGYGPGDIPQMVRDGTYPHVEPEALAKVRGLEQFMEKVPLGKVARVIIKARPDIWEAIVAEDTAGSIWFNKLPQHYLNQIRNPVTSLPRESAIAELPKKKMKLLTCDGCEGSWPCPEDEVANVKECPFCHLPYDKPAPSGDKVSDP